MISDKDLGATQSENSYIDYIVDLDSVSDIEIRRVQKVCVNTKLLSCISCVVSQL